MYKTGRQRPPQEQQAPNGGIAWRVVATDQGATQGQGRAHHESDAEYAQGEPEYWMRHGL